MGIAKIQNFEEVKNADIKVELSNIADRIAYRFTRELNLTGNISILTQKYWDKQVHLKKDFENFLIEIYE